MAGIVTMPATGDQAIRAPDGYSALSVWVAAVP
jgi:hypothetical protein